MLYAFFVIEFAAVSAVLLGAYRLRAFLGISAAAAAVAALQFLQAYLGASVFWEVAGRWTVSPGSFLLFTGNLALVLYAYANDGIQQARILLYAVVIGNATQSLFALVLTWHVRAIPPAGDPSHAEAVFSQSPGSALTGIAVLYLDQLLMVVVYSWCESRSPRLRGAIGFTIALVAAATFDSIAYLGVLFAGHPDLWAMIGSGMVSKAAGAVAFGVVWGPWIDPDSGDLAASPRGILETLTFREPISELEWAAKHDDLTGLLNRYSYQQVVRRLFGGEGDSVEPHGLLMCDLDRFKEVNDRLGHDRGDEFLVEVSDALREAVRDRDYTFRFGGDEFLILLRGAGPEGTRRVAEQIAALEFEDEALEKAVTLTVGAAVHPRDGEGPEELYDVADRRLYRGKERGGATAVGPRIG